jgi:hypothetical protein
MPEIGARNKRDLLCSSEFREHFIDVKVLCYCRTVEGMLLWE